MSTTIVNTHKNQSKTSVVAGTTSTSTTALSSERQTQTQTQTQTTSISSTSLHSHLKPVLMIPGFMSSGLEVQSLDPNDQDPENGKRVWLNLNSLGSHALSAKGVHKQSRKERLLKKKMFSLEKQQGTTARSNYNHSVSNNNSNNRKHKKISNNNNGETSFTASRQAIGPHAEAQAESEAQAITRAVEHPSSAEGATAKDETETNTNVYAQHDGESDDNMVDEGDDVEGDTCTLHYQKQLVVAQQSNDKSWWMNHMCLMADDMCTERPGCRVRAIPGLAGVDYLTDSKLTQMTSYVFGPLISALQKLGYEDGKNLDACPYDWRLPPSKVQERDNYLSNTMARVEQMVADNNGQPVVLLCHSLGCRMGHYFLNFVKDHPEEGGGQEWLDTHIDVYMQVGAPQMGVPKTIRGTVTGDKMSLDAFLTDRDGLVLGRSFGSVPWMMPTDLPPYNPAALPLAMCRQEGAIEITVDHHMIDCQQLLEERGDKAPKQLRFCIIYGNKHHDTETAHTPYKTPRHGMIAVGETLRFAAPATLKKGLGKIQVLLQEPGKHSLFFGNKRRVGKKEASSNSNANTNSANGDDGLHHPGECEDDTHTHHDDQDNTDEKDDANDDNTSPISATRRFIKSVVMDHAFPLLTNLASNPTLKRWNVANRLLAALGASHVSASSARIKINIKELAQQDILERTFPVDLFSGQNDTKKVGEVTVKIKYILGVAQANTQPAHKIVTSAKVGIMSLKDYEYSLPAVALQKGKNRTVRYDCLNGSDMLYSEGLEKMLNVISERYDNDALGPRHRCSLEAPPVKRVHSIYGINVPTEVSAVYRRRAAMVDNIPGKLKSRYVLDKKADIKPGWQMGNNSAGSYELKGGVIYETPKTPQIMDVNKPGNHKFEEKKKCCGDGTVPYWNLQHCHIWKSSLEDLKVDEIEGAEHREILADPRFHDILQQHLVILNTTTSTTAETRMTTVSRTDREAPASKSGDP
jgi:hypothetical protein